MTRPGPSSLAGLLAMGEWLSTRIGVCFLQKSLDIDWVDARDVAWGAVEAAEKGNDRDRYLLSGQYLAMSEVAAVVAELTGVSAPAFTCPTWLAGLFAPVMSTWSRLTGQSPLYTRDSLAALSTNKVMSHERAATTLGYAPRPFRRSMEDVLNFYKHIKQIDIETS